MLNCLQKEAYKMNVDSINYYLRMLVSNLAFTADYNSFSKGSKRLLLVEGDTDKQFIKGLINDDVACVIANKAFCEKKDFQKQKINYKSAIVQVVFGLSKIPILLSCP